MHGRYFGCGYLDVCVMVRGAGGLGAECRLSSKATKNRGRAGKIVQRVVSGGGWPEIERNRYTFRRWRVMIRPFRDLPLFPGFKDAKAPACLTPFCQR